MDGGGGHTYEYKQYARRWHMLGIIFTINVIIQIIFITYAPIATPASKYYRIDLTGINWLALVWPALFLPATPLAAWAFHKFGVRPTMAAAGCTMALGAGVRVLSVAVPIKEDENGLSSKGDAAYALVLIGTFIVATIQPIVLSSTTQVASAWFSEKQRAFANTLMSLGNPVGLALGSLISPAMSRETDGKGIDSILLLQFGLALMSAISCLFLQSSPPTAPSSTAPYRRGNDNLGRDFKSLRNNFGFMTLLNLFSLAVGGFQALLTLIEQILRPKGYNTSDAGAIAAVLVVSGIIGAAVAGPLIDYTRRYKLILSGSLSLAFPFTFGLAFNSQRQSRHGWLFACAALMGFFGFPVLPVALDLSAEITYPIPAGLTSSILWCGSQVTSLVLVTLVDGPLAEDSEVGPDSLEVGMWLLVGCFAAATALSWLWSGRYVRKEAEETVQRLRQAHRRDVGLPFVADVIDSPATDAVHQADGAMPGTPGPGNAAAVAAYVAASQAAAEGEMAGSPHRRGLSKDNEFTQLEFQ